MELEFKLTEEDYIAFNMDHVKSSLSVQKSIRIQRILGPITFLFFPLMFRSRMEIPLGYLLSLFGIASVVWFIFYPKYANREMKKRARKMLNEGDNEKLFIEKKFKFTEQGILQTSDYGETNVSWNEVNKVKETDEYIYIYTSSVSAHIIPKRVFRDEIEQQEVMMEISKHQDLTQEKI